jgi:hypothetical protein
MRGRKKLLLICLAGVAIVVAAAFYQSDIIGWWRGEAKYKGSYTNEWRSKLRSYVFCYDHDDGLWLTDGVFVQMPTKLDEWISKFVPDGFPRAGYDFYPPLRYPEPDAVPVLIELLGSREKNVRILAANSLENIGPPARDAVHALLASAQTNDKNVEKAALLAVWKIEPSAVPSRVWLYRPLFDGRDGPPYPETLSAMLPQSPLSFGLMLRKGLARVQSSDSN